jgi:hypothetical protein
LTRLWVLPVSKKPTFKNSEDPNRTKNRAKTTSFRGTPVFRSWFIKK